MAPLLAAAALLGCPATTVHYSTDVPWVQAGAMTGRVFAYGGRTLMDGRVNSSDGLVLYTHGRTPSGGTADDGTVVYPSIVEIPTSGCWAVRVTIGKRTGLAVFDAVVT